MDTKILEEIKRRMTLRTSRGLANALSEAIGEGALAEGFRLPPIRTVAMELDLSPSTVSVAWKLLARAGAIRSDGRRGTVVMARSGPGPTRYRRALERSITFGLDLSTGVPDAALLPDLTLALESLNRGGTSGSYLDNPIIPGLAEALRNEWPYEAEKFVIVDGAMDALDQVASHLLCFPPLLDLLDALGVRTIGVDVDDEGLVTTQLEKALTHRPKAVFVQPRAHNPLGVSLSKGRAVALAALLRETNIFIIEDDSAGAIASTAPISLGKWLPEQTVHIRSFSKSYGPDLRLAAMSGPALVMDGVRERRLLGQGWTSRLLQAVLLDLLTRGESQRQIERARAAYAHRRSTIATELARLGLATSGNDGLNLWLPVRDETAALLFLASRGVVVAAGSPFATKDGGTAHLRITVGLIVDDFERIAGELAEASRIAPAVGPR
jgi:DNA-binding transcriptional MocR family regulator